MDKIREKIERFFVLMILLGIPIFFLMLAMTRDMK